VRDYNNRGRVFQVGRKLNPPRAACPGDPLRPTAIRRQGGVPTGSATRGLGDGTGNRAKRRHRYRTRHRREARFQTRPGSLCLHRVESPDRAIRPGLSLRKPRKICAPDVSLHRDATSTAMHPFAQRLAHDGAAQTGLRQPQRRGNDRDRGGSTSSLPPQFRHKRRRRRLSDGLAIRSLKTSIASAFDPDVVPESQQGIDQVPVQTPPVRGFPSLGVRQFVLGGVLVAAAPPAFRAGPDAAIRQVVAGIVRPSPAILSPLESPLFLPALTQRRGRIDRCPPVCPSNAEGARAGIDADDAAANRVVRLAVGKTSTDQLREETGVCRLAPGARSARA
jgi:hypothetical protein